MPTNPYEARGREQKARKLANFIKEKLGTEWKDGLCEDHWDIAAECCGVKLPSTETRNLVYEILRGRESLDIRQEI